MQEKVNILLVDDRPEGLITLEAVLERPEYNLIKANSGSEALAFLLRNEIALILLDVQMPDMDGFETAAFIKQRERSKNIPIIFVTAINKEERYVARGYDAGAVDYLFKPFDPHILRSKVAVFVDLFRKNQQLKRQAEQLREGEARDRARHLAELELESLKRYRSLADAIPHIVWRASTDGLIDYFNNVWIRYTGLDIEQSIGNGWQAAFHPEDLVRFLDVWKQGMLDGKGFEVECRIRRLPDRMFRWHVVRGVPELKPDGRVAAWLGTSTDIHDRKENEVELTRAKESADAASEAKTSFLANMSHEIRTPLSAMLGFSELLANQDLSPDERVKYGATINRNGKQLLRIIDEILDISKIEAGKLSIEKIPVSVIQILKDIQLLLNLSAEEKGLRLTLDFDSPVPEQIVSDPTRLRQILINIIGNAIKFSDHGTVTVRLGFEESKSLLYFLVHDTGPGVSQEQASRLFQPFAQGDGSTTRKFGGTGLGLALSRRLARALGGDVVLESSEAGKGSTFKVSFATGRVQNAQFVSAFSENEGRVVERPAPESAKVSLEGVSVLLAEDAPDNQVLLKRFLSMAGAEVEIACNGLEAVQKGLAGNHQLILMDIQMPEMNGYEATQRLRQQGVRKPIIALTAHAMKEEKERCVKAGCDDHLTKPISRANLVQQVALHVNRAHHELH